MIKFKDLGIELEKKSFVGDKIKISKILNKEISVHGYEINASKFNGMCLSLQIKLGETFHIVFTSSTYLMEMIQKVPVDKFPIETIIIEENEHFEFS